MRKMWPNDLPNEVESIELNMSAKTPTLLPLVSPDLRLPHLQFLEVGAFN